MSVKGLIFIDANQYLDLYAMPSWKTLLPGLQEQQDHILVTMQVVDEVNRNKVSVTAGFLASKVNESKPHSAAAPNLSPKIIDAVVVRMRERLQNIREKLSHDLLEQVSQSKDEVSKGLAGVFSQAVAHTDGELQRARVRKERGNPPGKSGDPLGDQLNWEQILSHCKDKPPLWIMTRDSDYGTLHAGKMFLNAAFYQDLTRLYESEPTVFCFRKAAEGLEHFVNSTGAKAERLPTPEEIEQINKEQESLPPNDWLRDYDDSAQIVLRLEDTFRMRDATRWMTEFLSQVNSEVGIPPPQTKG